MSVFITTASGVLTVFWQDYLTKCVYSQDRDLSDWSFTATLSHTTAMMVSFLDIFSMRIRLISYRDPYYGSANALIPSDISSPMQFKLVYVANFN